MIADDTLTTVAHVLCRNGDVESMRIALRSASSCALSSLVVSL